MNAPSKTALLITSSDQREADRRIGPRSDGLDLYETVAVAASSLNACADSFYAAYLMAGEPTANIINDARSAAERVLAALDEYEREIG